MCSVCGGRRAAGASPIRCVGERITATGVPEFREVAWRACQGDYYAKANSFTNEAISVPLSIEAVKLTSPQESS
ncbi:hypothetical protein [Bathymodiolus japonicus methanotrophic gill symbiont]|uniref:hypothetical protein n=1 Tax=Bathymodiolus japonicus methanotrophic gill symbiont TaxID=113269 RepID=UPI001C8D45B9|nr:hypothetical protein [Bathymodiolus japonicus methanotrophic gill symbiont]